MRSVLVVQCSLLHSLYDTLWYAMIKAESNASENLILPTFDTSHTSQWHKHLPNTVSLKMQTFSTNFYITLRTEC